MSYLLHIDTSGDKASICLTENWQVKDLRTNESRNDHASWLHPAINTIFLENGITANHLEAVSVAIGPGSYTGLRIALSAAKGLCFALQCPLITINTLKMQALAAQPEASGLICAMIDARRMEVFAAVYTKHLEEVVAPHALIIDETSLAQLMSEQPILFCGNGSNKLPAVLNGTELTISGNTADASHLARLAVENFRNKEFAEIAYTEPLYIKDFYVTTRKNS